MKTVERRLLRQVPRGTIAVLGLLVTAQGVLLVVQADLLARALARLDTGPLPALAAVVAVRAAMAYGLGGVAGRLAATVKDGLRAALLARPQAPGPAGARVTLLTRGLDAVDPFFTGYLPQLLAACVVPPLVLARLAAADWASAAVIAVTVPLVPLFGALIGLRTAELTRRHWGLLHRLGGHFGDVLAGLATLRSHGRTGHQAQVVREMAAEHRRATGRALRVAFLSALVLELVCALSVALVAVPVGLRLLTGHLDLTTGLLVLLLTPEVYLPLRALGGRFHASAEGVAAAGQAFAALDAPGAPARTVRPRGGGRTAPQIVLEDVTVRHPGADRPALHRVSLVVRGGERVAVTGPSGAGKTTLLRLLAGFLVPEQGRVLVDGTDLAELDLAAWRRRLGWVPQRPHLFDGTVAGNIRLGDPGAGLDRVRQAARDAAAHDFITALPAGYDTPLGERGAGLSAGQRQRLALARAHLTGAPLMLLDEPTARLDGQSEAALLTAARRLLTGRTALIVAHRPASLALADRVVGLHEGRLISPGDDAAGRAA